MSLGAARPAGRLLVDPGIVVKINDSRIEMTRGQSGLIAEGTADRPIVFTSVVDDRYGGSGVFDTSGNGASVGARGDWAGIILNHASHASIDHALIAFAGGDAPIEGVADNFDAIEVHQARLRLANSIVENNAAGGSATDRSGRGFGPASDDLRPRSAAGSGQQRHPEQFGTRHFDQCQLADGRGEPGSRAQHRPAGTVRAVRGQPGTVGPLEPPEGATPSTAWKCAAKRSRRNRSGTTRTSPTCCRARSPSATTTPTAACVCRAATARAWW